MTESTTKVPTWFWIVSGLALIWNLLGVLAFYGNVTITPEAIAALPEAEQQLHNNTPIWSTIAFAIGVFGGALGSLGLLLRKSWAKPLFIASLIGVLVQNIYFWFMAEGVNIYGPERMAMPIMVIVIAALLIWLANWAKPKAWYN